MTTVLVIPSIPLPIGAASATSPAIPTAAQTYVLTINEVGWSYTGGQAMTLAISVSYDNGTIFKPLTSDAVQDLPIAAFKSFPANQFRVAASMQPEVGGVARLLKLDYVMSKALTISGKIDSI